MTSRRVPVWLALPIMLLLGVAGYAVISGIATGDPGTASVQSGSGGHVDHVHGGQTLAPGGTDHDAGTNHDGVASHDGVAADHSDHGAAPVPPGERPRALVLGGFAAVNGAVLVSAAVLRHRGAGRRRGGVRRS